MKNQTIAILGCICLILSAFLGGLYIGRNIGSTSVETSVLKPVPPSGDTQQATSTSETSAVPDVSEAPAAPTVAQKININTATAEELTALPGVGPVLAQSIVNYRQNHGRFQSLNDLMKVTGIGEKRFESIKEYITTGR